MLFRVHMCCRNTANNLVPVLLSLFHFPRNGHQAPKGSLIITFTRKRAQEVKHLFLRGKAPIFNTSPSVIPSHRPDVGERWIVRTAPRIEKARRLKGPFSGTYSALF